IPAFWLYGSDDRNVPTELCLERLAPLQADHDYSTVVLPTTHTPLVLPTGLLSSLPRSPGFDPRFFPALGDWLTREQLLAEASQARAVLSRGPKRWIVRRQSLPPVAVAS